MRCSVLLLIVVGATACASASESSGSTRTGAGLPASNGRAVSVIGSSCGDTSHTSGSGIIIGDGLVVTAAHVVIGATDVTVDQAFASEVVVLDTVADLALLEVSAVEGSPVEFGSVRNRTRVVIETWRGTVAARVQRAVRISVDEVRGASKVERGGLELAGPIRGGDSGSGVFDADGCLVGVVFAKSTTRHTTSFAVDAEAVRRLVGQPRILHECVPARSRIAPDLSSP